MEVSVQGVEIDVAVVDSGGILHSSIHWPKDGLVRDLAAGIEMFVSKLLWHSDVYVLFNPYFEKSHK